MSRKRTRKPERTAPLHPEERARLLEEVRRRLRAGELDSDCARVETAYALLDGDRPPITRR